MFEIWQHLASGRRYLVVVRQGYVSVAAGPLHPSDDPRRVLGTHGNQEHDPRVLLDMHHHPDAYRREYTTDPDGRAVRVPHGEERAPDAP